MFLQRLHADDPFNSREPTLEEQEILDQEPELDDQMLLVLEAWQELDSCRQLGMGISGKIPIDKLYIWAAVNGLDHELMQMVADAIRYLDGQRLERLASEQEHRNGG